MHSRVAAMVGLALMGVLVTGAMAWAQRCPAGSVWYERAQVCVVDGTSSEIVVEVPLPPPPPVVVVEEPAPVIIVEPEPDPVIIVKPKPDPVIIEKPAPAPPKVVTPAPANKPASCSQALANCNYVCTSQPAHTRQQCFNTCLIGFNNCN